MALAGTLPTVDTSRRFAGGGPWGDDGLSRTRLTPVLDGDLVRRLDVGQAGYVYRGGVTFVQVKRLTGRQAAIGSGVAAMTPPTGAVPGRTAEPVPGWVTAGAGVGEAAVTAEFPVVPPAGRPARPVTVPVALPDASEVLDEAFGGWHE